MAFTVLRKCPNCDENGMSLRPNPSSLLGGPEVCDDCGGTAWIEWGEIEDLEDRINDLEDKLKDILDKLKDILEKLDE